MKLLQGVRVLDISWLIPGPHTTMMLADLGADVIKIETPPPTLGDYFRGVDQSTMSANFVWLNRGKRSITVDFKRKEGQELIRDLVRTSHVFVEGSRPGAITKYGLSYEELSAINPKIVYCSVSGFGQDGPLTGLASHGGAFDALSGVATPVKAQDGGYLQWRPYPHPGVTNGPWLAALGIVSGLFQAQMTGKGCYIDIACADGAFMSFTQEILRALNGGTYTDQPPAEPTSSKYTYYETKDGKFMLVAATERHLWEEFCEAIGRPDLKDRGDWETTRIGRDRSPEDAQALRKEIIPIMKTKTQAQWTKIFNEKRLAGAPYTDPNDYHNSEYLKARGMIVEHHHPKAGKLVMTANAIKVKGDPFEIKRPAPDQGEHTDEVLKEFGYSAQQIADLRARGVT